MKWDDSIYPQSRLDHLEEVHEQNHIKIAAFIAKRGAFNKRKSRMREDTDSESTQWREPR